MFVVPFCWAPVDAIPRHSRALAIAASCIESEDSELVLVLQRALERRAALVPFGLVSVGGRTIVCGIAMDRSAIARDNVVDCASVERNVFVNSVELQNQGYAYMPIA